MTKHVVLLAEQLSSATVEALGPDFDIRRCDGTRRAETLAIPELERLAEVWLASRDSGAG